jgi:beta-galactosidase
VAPGMAVTTNYDPFAWGENVDLRRMFAGLDVVGFDLYTREAHEIAFYCDLMHDVLDRPFWFMEYDISSPALAAELDGIAASGLCARLFFFKFRPFPWGQEQGTRSLLTVTGAPAPNLAAVAEWTAAAPATAAPAARAVGLVYDFDSSWAATLTGWSGLPKDLVYAHGMIDPVYRSLHALGQRARFVLRPTDLHRLALVVAPWLVIHDPEMEDALLRHVHAGGTALITQDCFLKNRDNVFNETLPRLYREALGVADFLDHQPAGAHGLVHEARHGAGRVVMLAARPAPADWDHWLAALLG